MAAASQPRPPLLRRRAACHNLDTEPILERLRDRALLLRVRRLAEQANPDRDRLPVSHGNQTQWKRGSSSGSEREQMRRHQPAEMALDVLSDLGRFADRGPVPPTDQVLFQDPQDRSSLPQRELRQRRAEAPVALHARNPTSTQRDPAAPPPAIPCQLPSSERRKTAY